MRRSPPHPPMIRYIGTSSASKNTKNSSRSSATNDPSTAVSRTSIDAMYSRTFFLTGHDASTDSGNRNVVSSTIQRLTPSMPTRYCSPMLFTHVACSTNWYPLSARSNFPRIASETTNVTTAVSIASDRAELSGAPRHTIRSTAPTSGRNVTIVSR